MTSQRAVLVRQALAHLREARKLLRAANCHRAVAKVLKAIKSTEGAVRHADADKYRTKPEVDCE
jgi:hypothetical protein